VPASPPARSPGRRADSSKPAAPPLETRAGFITQITRPMSIFAAALLVAEFGFVGGGVASPDHGEVLFVFAGLVMLSVILAVSVLSYVRPGIWRTEEDPLRRTFARNLAQDIFNLIDGIAGNSANEEEQVFIYADLLLALRKVDEGDDEPARDFRKRMAESADSYANSRLSPAMRQKILEAIDTRKSEIQILLGSD
jgi:hypothetical protein